MFFCLVSDDTTVYSCSCTVRDIIGLNLATSLYHIVYSNMWSCTPYDGARNGDSPGRTPPDIALAKVFRGCRLPNQTCDLIIHLNNSVFWFEIGTQHFEIVTIQFCLRCVLFMTRLVLLCYGGYITNVHAQMIMNYQ